MIKTNYIVWESNPLINHSKIVYRSKYWNSFWTDPSYTFQYNILKEVLI